MNAASARGLHLPSAAPSPWVPCVRRLQAEALSVPAVGSLTHLVNSGCGGKTPHIPGPLLCFLTPATEASMSALPRCFISHRSQATAVFVQIRVCLLCKPHSSFPRHRAAAACVPTRALFARQVVSKQTALDKPQRALPGGTEQQARGSLSWLFLDRRLPQGSLFQKK